MNWNIDVWWDFHCDKVSSVTGFLREMKDFHQGWNFHYAWISRYVVEEKLTSYYQLNKYALRTGKQFFITPLFSEACLILSTVSSWIFISCKWQFTQKKGQCNFYSLHQGKKESWNHEGFSSCRTKLRKFQEDKIMLSYWLARSM